MNRAQRQEAAYTAYLDRMEAYVFDVLSYIAELETANAALEHENATLTEFGSLLSRWPDGVEVFALIGEV